MFLAAVILSFILATFSFGGASAISASLIPGASKSALAFATRVNATGFGSIIASDQARARAFIERDNALASGKAPVNVPITNTPLTYVANVGVGKPPTYYSLLIDTGSSNTWIGARKAYVKTSTSKSTGKAVSVSYGFGGFAGTEYTDQVTLSPSLVINSQSIGVANYSAGFDAYDGILGIGPVDLTNDTVQGIATIPTVTDNLFSQGIISSDVIGIFFAPNNATSGTEKNGELTFGGVDTSKITSPIKYTPLTTSSDASKYWGINQSITYGNITILPSTSGIVDTGTTLILLANGAYKKYQQATGATHGGNGELLKITTAQYKKLKPLNFNINGVTYSLNANAQIWPRALNSYIGGSPSDLYLVVNSIGYDSASIDFINGYAFLERYYSVYDTKNKRVGFAPTAYTFAETNH